MLIPICHYLSSELAIPSLFCGAPALPDCNPVLKHLICTLGIYQAALPAMLDWHPLCGLLPPVDGTGGVGSVGQCGFGCPDIRGSDELQTFINRI